eukprot:gene21313-27343_t
MSLHGFNFLTNQFEHLLNVHIRIEEPFKAHFTTENQSELMCTGIVIDRLEIRPVTPVEKTASPHLYLATNPKTSLVKHALTLGQVCNFHYHREGGNILEPLSFTLSFSGGFQKMTQVFGPIVIDLHTESVDVNVTDEQTFYVYNLIHSIKDHMYRLQSNAWVAFAKSPLLGVDRKRLARLRWDMVRKSIKVDWQKYTSKLRDGNMKWRAWFETWRLAGRYVALREILMYHVGYESFTDAATGMVSYAIRENLIMNYTQHNGAKDDDAAIYVGKGNISEHVLRAAESLIYKQIVASNSYFMLVHNAQHTRQSVAINPFDLSSIALRALYALQIDLDSQLPFKVSAFCRIYAEDKYKMKQLQRKQAGLSSESDSHDAHDSRAIKLTDTDEDAIITGSVVREKLQCTLLVSALDATNLRPSFGATSVNAYVTLQTGSWHSGGATVTTETKPAKANSATSSAFVQWGNMCSLSVDPHQIHHLTGAAEPSSDSSSVLNSHITVECFDRGLFSICYGSTDVKLSALLPTARPADSSSSEFTSEIASHNIKLTRSSSLLFGVAAAAGSVAEETNSAVVRLVTMLVVGGEEARTAATNRFQEKITEMLSERKTVLMRQEKLASNESFSNSLSNKSASAAEGEDDEGESFILDPSMLTVQDIQLSVSLPSVTLQVFAVYVVPSASRDDGNEDLPSEANIPLLKVSLKGVRTKATASNNPWVLRGTGSVDQLKLQVLQTDPSLTAAALTDGAATPTKSSLPEPLLSLPRLTGTYSLTQISTMGRSIDGKLDISCFDFNGSVSMYPFTVAVNPQALFSSTTTRGVNVWRAVRALDHLWLKPAKWAKGMSSAHIGVDGKPPRRLKPEASIRLGDLYMAHPQHLNVVTEVWGTVSNPPTSATESALEGTSATPLLPKQQTRVKCLTPARSMDVDVVLQPSVRSLKGETLEEVIQANVIGSANLKTYEAPTNIFNSWFGAVTAPVEHAHAPATSTPVIPQATDAAGWAVERRKLMERIHELEERNKALSVAKK